MQGCLLEVKNLSVQYKSCGGFFKKSCSIVAAVNNVSLRIQKGRTLGLVGESGRGNSTLRKAIIRLAPITSGEIDFEGECISNKTNRAFFPYRKKIQMVFQDSFNSLDPRMTIESMLLEPLDIHFKHLSRKQRHQRVLDLLDQVGLPSNSLNLIRTSSVAVSANALALHVHWRSSLNYSFATSRSVPWTFPFKRRWSTY